MNAIEIIERWENPNQLANIGKAAVRLCQETRQSFRAQLEEKAARAAHPPYRDENLATRSATPDDVNEALFPKADFAAVLAAQSFASEQLKVLPPKHPTYGEAVYWLARSEVLILIERYTLALSVAAAFHQGIRKERPDEKTFNLVNILCEPTDDDFGPFLWIGLCAVLLPRYPVEASLPADLLRLLDCLRSVIEIFYSLSEAYYKDDRVLACRRAFEAYWRAIGTRDVPSACNAFVAARQKLDADIKSGALHRVEYVTRDQLDLVLASVESLQNQLNALRYKVEPPSEDKKRRGPKGKRQEIGVQFAAEVYRVSAGTICNWDVGKGKVPYNYPGRNVSIDEFIACATRDHRAMGHKEGVTSDILEGIRDRSRRSGGDRRR